MASTEATESMTLVNKIKSQNPPLVGTISTISSTMIAQIIGKSDSDMIFIDMEHAPQPIDTVTQMVNVFNAASHGKKISLIRIPSHGVEWVKWGLDSGASGIIVPMVNNATEMAAILDRALYPPKGRRSYGPIYAGLTAPGGQAGYFQSAMRGDIAILPMIESKQGLENVEEIMSRDGVTGVLVGPADLRLALGMSVAIDGPEAEFTDALKKIVSTGHRLGKVVGIVALGDEAIKKRATEGFDFIFTGFDMGALMAGLATELKSAKSSVEAGAAASTDR